MWLLYLYLSSRSMDLVLCSSVVECGCNIDDDSLRERVTNWQTAIGHTCLFALSASNAARHMWKVPMVSISNTTTKLTNRTQCSICLELDLYDNHTSRSGYNTYLSWIHLEIIPLLHTRSYPLHHSLKYIRFVNIATNQHVSTGRVDARIPSLPNWDTTASTAFLQSAKFLTSPCIPTAVMPSLVSLATDLSNTSLRLPVITTLQPWSPVWWGGVSHLAKCGLHT